MTGGVLDILKRGVGWVAGLLVLAVIWAVSALAQTPERRVALLIGNAAYSTEVGGLINPVNDVNALRDTLVGLGFRREDVVVLPNANRVQMLRAITQFRGTLAGLGKNDVAFFYFSGHGAQPAGREGRLSLIPIGTSAPTDDAFWFETIAFDTEVIETFEAARSNAALIVAVDACRNELRLPNKNLGGGDKGFVVVPQMDGMLISFAAKPGQSAKDQPSASGARTDLSPYAQALIEGLQMPGQTLSTVFTELRPRVISLTGGAQQPTVTIELNRKDLVLRPGTPGPGPAPVDVCEGARRDWEVVRTGGGVEALLLYERSHSGCVVYARLAREEIDRRDDDAWSSAQGVNTQAGYEAYIRAHGSGRYVSLARVKTDEFKRLAARGPGTVFRDGFTSGSGQGPEMVVLPSGSFMMGSPEGETDRWDREGPQRSVRIGYEFAVGRYEVTWSQYSACVSAGACPAAEDDGFGQGSRPVTNVSWNDAQAYVTWLNQKTGLTGRSDRYRLLSEAEWEYAARAGSKARWSFGDDESRLGNFAWFSSNTGSRTQPVGGKTANGFGLYDMHGNVWEWVEDCYESGYSVQPSDGSAFTKSSCSGRVIRGGSWLNAPRNLRSASRDRYTPGLRSYYLGFRLARTLP